MTVATGQEHEDSDGGGDCEDVTMENGGMFSPLSGGSCPSRPAEAGGGGDAKCLTAGDRIKREGKQDCGNDGVMKVCDDYDN